MMIMVVLVVIMMADTSYDDGRYYCIFVNVRDIFANNSEFGAWRIQSSRLY